MPYKWNEKSTLVFLNAYKKHPCLWNPTHVKYYDCLAKNEALKNVIKELNIPEMNISDCLDHIKVIREKYGQEQLRLIKALQSFKSYTPPFIWFPVISEMLTEVINDESKLQSRMGSTKTISPPVLKNYVTMPYDKNILNFPSAQKDTKEYCFKNDANEAKPKSVKFKKSDLLQYPSCGWENIKLDKLCTKKTSKKHVKLSDVTIPYSKCIKSHEKSYKQNIQRQTIDNLYQQGCSVSCSNFLLDLPICPGYPSNILTSQEQNARKTQQTCTDFAILKPQLSTKEIQLSNNQLSPKKRKKPIQEEKQVGTCIENDDKGIQNTIQMSKSSVTPIFCTCATMRKSSNVRETARKDHREVQDKFLTQGRLKHAAVNTIKQCDKETQNCTVREKATSPVPERVCTKAVKSPESNRREVKEVCFTSDKKKSIENEITETCSPDVTEIVKYNSVVIEALLECLEKMIQFQEESVNSSSSEVTVCEPMDENFATNSAVRSESYLPEEMDRIDFVTLIKTFLELMKDAIILNNKKRIKNDGCISKEDAIDTFAFLNKIKDCTDKILKIHMITKCLKKQSSNKFYARRKDKKYPKQTVCRSMETNYLSYPQIEVSENGMEQCTASSEDVEILYRPAISEMKDQVTYANLRDTEVPCKFPTTCTDHCVSANRIATVETAVGEKTCVKDKEVVARTENHDVGLNSSLCQVLHHDLETQSSMKQFRAAAVETDRKISKQKINAGTQNCKSISLCVTKCNNLSVCGTPKVNKATCICNHVTWAKYMETCLPHPHSSKNTYQKCFVRDPYHDELPSASRMRGNKVNYANYHMSSLPKKTYKTYDRQCRNILPYDPLSLELLENEHVSRIPLYAGSRKYVRRRTDLYRLSQLYT